MVHVTCKLEIRNKAIKRQKFTSLLNQRGHKDGRYLVLYFYYPSNVSWAILWYPLWTNISLFYALF